MDKGILAALWTGLYLLCCVLGFLPAQEGFSFYVMLLASLAFFVPPFWLLLQAKKQNDHKMVKLVRRISLLSLGLTTVLLVANFLSVLSASEVLGKALHILLCIAAVPMMSSGSWLVSLFLWACLLFTSLSKKKS